MTCPTPILNSNGLPRSREESNFFPLVSVPMSSVCGGGEGRRGGKRMVHLRTGELEASVNVRQIA